MGVALTLKLDSAVAAQKSRINRLIFVTSGDETNSEMLTLTRPGFQDGEERLIYRPLKSSRNISMTILAQQNDLAIAQANINTLAIDPAQLISVTVVLVASSSGADMGDMNSSVDASSTDANTPTDGFTMKDFAQQSDMTVRPIAFADPVYASIADPSILSLAVGRFLASPELPRGVALPSFDNHTISTVLRGCEVGQTTPVFQTGNKPVAVASGDFNRDGWTDFATANQAANNVTVILSAGDGNFLAPVNYAVGNAPVDIVVADFNGDTFLDWATANRDSNSISIAQGNGSGAFTSDITITGVMGVMNAIAAGNVYTLDSPHPDIVVATQSGLRIYIDNMNGYGTAGNSETGDITTVEVGDLNGDATDEILLAIPAENAIAVLTNRTRTLTVPIPGAPGTLLLEDFNLDGRRDIAVGYKGSGIFVYAGLGNGEFQFSKNYPLADQPRALAAGELISSVIGKMDIVALIDDKCGVYANTSP